MIESGRSTGIRNRGILYSGPHRDIYPDHPDAGVGRAGRQGAIICFTIDSIQYPIKSPIIDSQYLVGKFIGLALLLLVSLAILYVLAAIAVFLTSLQYPPFRPLHWKIYLLVGVFEYVMLLVISAVLVLLNSFATSTFLPMALTLAVYCIGQSTTLVKDYLATGTNAQEIAPVIGFVAKASYYIFPNLSAFDIKTAFVYSLPVHLPYLMMVLLYGVFYMSVMIFMATFFFGRRDLT